MNCLARVSKTLKQVLCEFDAYFSLSPVNRINWWVSIRESFEVSFLGADFTSASFLKEFKLLTNFRFCIFCSRKSDLLCYWFVYKNVNFKHHIKSDESRIEICGWFPPITVVGVENISYGFYFVEFEFEFKFDKDTRFLNSAQTWITPFWR